MTVRTSRALTIPAILACLTFLLTACGSETSDPAATETSTTMPPDTNSQDSDSGTVQGTVIDDRTIVFDAGTNLGGPSAHTPDNDAVQAVLATVETHEDLTWARNHTRFIYGNEDPDDTPAARVFFACDQPPLTDPAQALALFETVSGIDGGGDCYGQAAIALDGSLLWSNTN